MAAGVGFAAADEELVIGWDDIDTFGDFTTFVPADYQGFTWSGEQNGGGRGMVDLLSAISGNIPVISGPNVFYSGFGDDDIWVDLGGDYFLKSAYLTAWPLNGPPNVRVEGWQDGKVVYDQAFDIADNVWTVADFGGVKVDEIHFYNTSGGQSWWLMDDLTLTKIPGPMTLAVFGLGFAVSRRRRSA